MKTPPLFAALLVAAAGAHADGDFSAQVRARWDDRQAATLGPIADGARLAPGLVEPQASAGRVESELRGRWRAVGAAVLLREERPEGGAWKGDAVVNELHLSGEAAGWQFSAGRKVVAWDVGYGFRPNDVVQQEARRTLVASTPQGRAVLQAEHFDAKTAWSWVWVNPQRAAQGEDRLGTEEQALAMRVFRQAGSVDLHGFARYGQHTRTSVGAATSWVATDSLELHASGRVAERADVLRADGASGLVTATPYRLQTGGKAAQALVGGTWTGESKLSVMAEWWYDSTAAADAQWDAWFARNATLRTLPAFGAPPVPTAGNLGWQAQAFGTPSLRRNNVFFRASWDHDGWQPALDVLLMPADRGRLWTASLGWQGDRVRLDGGVRWSDGPDASVAMQLPVRRTAYVALTWSM